MDHEYIDNEFYNITSQYTITSNNKLLSELFSKLCEHHKKYCDIIDTILLYINSSKRSGNQLPNISKISKQYFIHIITNTPFTNILSDNILYYIINIRTDINLELTNKHLVTITQYLNQLDQNDYITSHLYLDKICRLLYKQYKHIADNVIQKCLCYDAFETLYHRIDFESNSDCTKCTFCLQQATDKGTYY